MEYRIQRSFHESLILHFVCVLESFTAYRNLLFYYIICTELIGLNPAPQTTLWGGPGPRFEPGTGGSSGRFANH